MKRVTVLLTLLTMTLALSFAAKPPQGGGSTSAKVTVSCATCLAGQPLTISGSGFAGRKGVAVSIVGPNTLSLNVTADSKGKFTLHYPTGLGFAPGSYLVNATQFTTSASAGFQIQ